MEPETPVLNPATLHPPQDLRSRLSDCAQGWADAHDAPLSRLGKRVTGNANFFERLAAGEGFTIATLEKFAAFLTDGSNWPEGAEVPAEVIAFGHAVGVSAPAPALSAGDASGISPLSREHAA